MSDPVSPSVGLGVVHLFTKIGIRKGDKVISVNGQPVPYAEVEVEYYNRDKKATAPTAYMVTQTIKADQNGVFTYAAPVPGWWGFAALNEADFTLKTDAGEQKGVELGAVLWVHFEAWK